MPRTRRRSGATALLADMFSDVDSPSERLEYFEEYKQELNDSYNKAASGDYRFIPKVGIVNRGAAERAHAALERMDAVTKSMSADQVGAMRADLDAARSAMADVVKDWTLTFPNAQGLVPYDLEPGAKVIVPRETPLRNSTLRDNTGKGTARQYKRLTGWTNSQTGGVADLSPFMNSQTVSTSFGGLNLRRGQKISYASDSASVTYVEQGFSDQVNWVAQFAGLGFDDVRQLSHTALLWAHMLGEEKAQIKARGASGNGYSGSVAAPVISAAYSNSGGAIAAGTYYAYVTSVCSFGETLVSNQPAPTAITGSTGSITINVTTEPTGGLYYKLYVGTTAATPASTFFQTTFIGNSFTLTSYSSAGAGAPTTDTSFDPNGYDGWLAVLTNPALSGYFNRVNAKLSQTNPGTEFQTMFLSMYRNNLADPDELWAEPGICVEAGDLLKTSSSTGYRVMIQNEGEAHTLGTVVNGILNQITHKMVDLNPHRFVPLGCAFARSLTLPIQDAEIPAPTAIVNVQDYAAFDWPVIQYTYDQSTYLFGTMVHYAPAWHGALVGIQ